MRKRIRRRTRGENEKEEKIGKRRRSRMRQSIKENRGR